MNTIFEFFDKEFLDHRRSVLDFPSSSLYIIILKSYERHFHPVCKTSYDIQCVPACTSLFTSSPNADMISRLDAIHF